MSNMLEGRYQSERHQMSERCHIGPFNRGIDLVRVDTCNGLEGKSLISTEIPTEGKFDMRRIIIAIGSYRHPKLTVFLPMHLFTRSKHSLSLDGLDEDFHTFTVAHL